jgi:YVTN family beta-propeller protein
MEFSGEVPTQPSLVRQRLSRFAPAAVLLLITIGLSSCGDIYRPVANPIIPPGANPAQTFYAIVVGPNGTSNGNAATVDVSGDTNIGNAVLGVNPVHVSVFSTSIALAANQGSDSVTLYQPNFPSLTTTTVTLPPGSAPVFSAQNSTSAYVADYGLNQVAVISSALKAATGFINVGTHPIAVAITPDNAKVFCVNQGDGTVTVISTLDNSVLATIPVGHNPVRAVMRADGAFYYVVNQADGTVSVIDTGAQAVIATLSVGTSPFGISYDANLSRLYVANTGSNTVSVFSANTNTPVLLHTVSTGSAPMAATGLQDGSKFYVANSGDNTVSVFNALSFVPMKTIAVGTNPVWIASSPDSTKVYTPNKGSGNVSIINTQTDTVPVTLTTPSPNPTFVAMTQ